MAQRTESIITALDRDHRQPSSWLRSIGLGSMLVVIWRIPHIYVGLRQLCGRDTVTCVDVETPEDTTLRAVVLSCAAAPWATPPRSKHEAVGVCDQDGNAGEGESVSDENDRYP